SVRSPPAAAHAGGSRWCQRSLQKSRQQPAVDILEGRFAGTVMAAGQDGHLVSNVQCAELTNQILGKFDGKGQVVSRVDEQRLAVPQSLEIPPRADGLPQRSQQPQLDVAVQSLSDVLS